MYMHAVALPGAARDDNLLLDIVLCAIIASDLLLLHHLVSTLHCTPDRVSAETQLRRLAQLALMGRVRTTCQNVNVCYAAVSALTPSIPPMAMPHAVHHRRSADEVSRNDDRRTGMTTRTPPSESPTCISGLRSITSKAVCFQYSCFGMLAGNRQSTFV